MGKLLDAVERFLIEDEWHYEQVGDKPVLKMLYGGDNGEWTCLAQVSEELEQFVFYSICPSRAPQAKRLAMAEFLTRANSGLVIGNFEMDFETGEIRYKTGIDVEGDRLSSALVRTLIYQNVLMMDRYFPGIMAVIFTSISPKEAIELIELD
ncbi:MAG: YbjN domain-containing protein [Fimbriimonadales bacterium]